MTSTEHHMAAMSEPPPKPLTPTDRIDAWCKHLTQQLEEHREDAAAARARADRSDLMADAVRAELGDWNRVRAAALQGQPSERVLGTGSAS